MDSESVADIIFMILRALAFPQGSDARVAALLTALPYTYRAWPVSSQCGYINGYIDALRRAGYVWVPNPSEPEAGVLTHEGQELLDTMRGELTAR